MEKVLVNDNLELAMPDGFRTMERDEVKKAYGFDYDCLWGMRDEERHMMLTIIWKVSNKVLAKLGTAKIIAEQQDKGLRKRFKRMGYQSGDVRPIEIAGIEGCNFSYSYELEGTELACETNVVKDGTCCYSIYYYTRADCAEENRSLYEDILASMKLVE